MKNKILLYAIIFTSYATFMPLMYLNNSGSYDSYASLEMKQDTFTNYNKHTIVYGHIFDMIRPLYRSQTQYDEYFKRCKSIIDDDSLIRHYNIVNQYGRDFDKERVSQVERLQECYYYLEHPGNIDTITNYLYQLLFVLVIVLPIVLRNYVASFLVYIHSKI